MRWEATTARTLPEFDTLGHGTVAAVELLAARPPTGPTAVVGVGQGHLALALAELGAESVDLVDRDLLALRTAAANLAAANSPPPTSMQPPRHRGSACTIGRTVAPEGPPRSSPPCRRRSRWR